MARFLRYFSFSFLALAAFALIFPLLTPVTLAADQFADANFQKLWNRTDLQVNNGSLSRTFLWGPSPNTPGLYEPYQEAPGGQRLVQYFDKSRMEITYPGGDQSSPYYVTNGLIAKELMTGQLQLGDAKFEQRDAADIGVAGDPDDTGGPTYRGMERVDKPAATDDTGILVAGYIDRDGNTSFDVGNYGKKWQVSNAYFEPSTRHNIAGPFWTFLNQSTRVLNSQGQSVAGRLFDPVYYATGLPITEAYWASVKVAGQFKDVLVQSFERRVLTFTPTNDPAYQVEMGNVGQHYFKWRYGTAQPQPAPAPPTTPNPPSTGPGGQIPGSFCLPAASSGQGDQVQACVNNPNPGPNTDETVYGRLIVNGSPAAGAIMNTTWNYKTTTSNCSGTAGNDGVASCTLKVGRPSPGYEVKIDVVFSFNGKTYRGQTSFTP